jgi:hypothetical protein
VRRPNLLAHIAVASALAGVPIGFGMGGSGRPDFGPGQMLALDPRKSPPPPRRDHGEKERSLAERKARRAKRKQRRQR